MDCGIKLTPDYNRGDVCAKCFDEFNGMTLEEIIGEIPSQETDNK